MSATTRGHNPDPSAIKRRWRTPPGTFHQLNGEFHFGLDAAAEPGAQLCPVYIAASADDQVCHHPPAALDCLTTDWTEVCPTLPDGQPGWAWFNCPWGPVYHQCPAGCRKKHAHHPDSFPGTGAFVDAAIRNAARGLGVVLLVPTAPDTTWCRAAFRASVQVRLTPRISFIDPETGEPAPAPPGCGCTLFVMRGRPLVPASVVLAAVTGRVL